jgi:hypothetical protein
MNDDQLRMLVRAAIAQHMGTAQHIGSPGRSAAQPSAQVLRHHASHGIFTTLSDGASDDGPCVIEPAVPCNHCGYCKSYGH